MLHDDRSLRANNKYLDKIKKTAPIKKRIRQWPYGGQAVYIVEPIPHEPIHIDTSFFMTKGRRGRN